MLKYPLYEALLGDADEGILRISLVENPAVESNWQAYDKEEEKNIQLYSIEDEDQHIITGVFLRADYPILRKDEAGEYYYITFSREVIESMVTKWMAENRANLINQAHQENTDVEDIYLQEVYFKNEDKGISPKGYEDIADGSAFATYKVLNDDVWEKIKSGEFQGYSIECVTEVRKVEEEDNNEEEQLYDDIIGLLKELKK